MTIFSRLRDSKKEQSNRNTCRNISQNNTGLSNGNNSGAGERPSISVVLGLYKKPEGVLKQIEALHNQTLKPAEIVLFQDGIQNDYTIELRESFKNHFDNVHICTENVGVWGRFNYARQAKGEYVCVFDDDTIPGRRWLENCWTHFQRQEGIYGTIGIVLTKQGLYPVGGHFRVGWAVPYGKCVEVDFVGHSWFFKREWLEYMFDGTEAYQQFKYVGEDMGLSFACQKRGIKTFVPPHPVNDVELWGNTPRTADALAMELGSLSMNNSNLYKMRDVLRLYEENGWELLYMRNKKLVSGLKRKIMFIIRKKQIKNIIETISCRIIKKLAK